MVMFDCIITVEDGDKDEDENKTVAKSEQTYPG